MGRIAGPLTKHRYTELWKQEVTARRATTERRRHLPTKPFVAPPAMRRRMALLWFIANEFDGSLAVGWEYCPPMTDDMRWLLSHGSLRIERKRIFDRGFVRQTLLSVTDVGSIAIAAATILEADKRWILAAYSHDMLM